MMYSEDEAWYNYSDYFSDDLAEPCPHQTANRVLVLVPHFLSVTCILGLLGNALVILTYACYKRTRSMTDVFLLNVAVADLMFVLTLPLFVGSQVWAWPVGVAACKLLRGSYSVNLYSSTLLLACVSVDRYVAIVQARRSFRLRSLTCSLVACGAVWLCALLLSVPTFYFYTWYQPSHTSSASMKPKDNDNDTAPELPSHVCEFRFDNSQVAKVVKVAVPSAQVAVGFFLPLCVMSICYGAVIVTLMKAKNFQRHKAVRVVLAVVAVFVVCHVPYNMALLYNTIRLFEHQGCPASDGQQVALTLTQMLAYLHCCLNPLLYAFVGVKFRSHFRRIFWDLWCLGKRSLGPRRSSRVTSEVFVSSRRSADGSSNNGSSFTM